MNKWSVEGEEVKEVDHEESFAHRQDNSRPLGGRSEFFNPIVKFPPDEFKPGEDPDAKKNSWRQPQRNVKTILHRRSTTTKKPESVTTPVFDTDSPPPKRLDAKLVHYEFVTDFSGQVQIERKQNSTAIKNRKQEGILEDPAATNISKYAPTGISTRTPELRNSVHSPAQTDTTYSQRKAPKT